MTGHIDSANFSAMRTACSPASGSLTLSPDSQTGLLSGTALGQVNTYSYSELGEGATYEAVVNGTPVYAAEYTRDQVAASPRKPKSSMESRTPTRTPMMWPAG